MSLALPVSSLWSASHHRRRSSNFRFSCCSALMAVGEDFEKARPHENATAIQYFSSDGQGA